MFAQIDSLEQQVRTLRGTLSYENWYAQLEKPYQLIVDAIEKRYEVDEETEAEDEQ